METRKEIIKQMGDEMREDIFLGINQRIQRSLRRKLWMKVSAIAASAALLFGVSNYISFQEGYRQLNSQQIEMTNPMGMKSSITLSDGTKVILNAGTTLSYPTAFVTKEREVQVRGEAFFEVTHDQARPFIVKAENIRVKVLGTKFNVKAYKEEDHIEVTLTEGKVGVSLEKGNAIRITPGQQIKYSKTDNSLLKRQVNLNNYTAWVSGKFYFSNRPLEKIATQLERYFNVHIEILGEDLKKAAFTGDFTHGENLDQILKVMTLNRNMTYKIDGDQISISKK